MEVGTAGPGVCGAAATAKRSRECDRHPERTLGLDQESWVLLLGLKLGDYSIAVFDSGNVGLCLLVVSKGVQRLRN